MDSSRRFPRSTARLGFSSLSTMGALSARKQRGQIGLPIPRPPISLLSFFTPNSRPSNGMGHGLLWDFFLGPHAIYGQSHQRFFLGPSDCPALLDVELKREKDGLAYVHKDI